MVRESETCQPAGQVGRGRSSGGRTSTERRYSIDSGHSSLPVSRMTDKSVRSYPSDRSRSIDRSCSPAKKKVVSIKKVTLERKERRDKGRTRKSENEEDVGKPDNVRYEVVNVKSSLSESGSKSESESESEETDPLADSNDKTSKKTRKKEDVGRNSSKNRPDSKH